MPRQVFDRQPKNKMLKLTLSSKILEKLFRPEDQWRSHSRLWHGTPKDFFKKKFLHPKKKKKTKNLFTYPFHGTPNITSTTITSQHSFYLNLVVFNKVVKQSGLRIFYPISCLDIAISSSSKVTPPLFFFFFYSRSLLC